MIVNKFSKRGQYHISINAKNQDFVYSFENSDICYIAIADGASNCENSKRGAEIACKCIKNLLVNCNIFDFEAKKIAYIIWEEIMFHIKNEARKKNTALETFASTFAFACFNKSTNALLTYNLGDSAIFIKYNKKNEYTLLSAPKRHNGNCTLTPDPNAYKDVEITSDSFFNGSVLLCSDGFYNIVLSTSTDIEDIIKKPDIFNSEDDFSFILLEKYDEVSAFCENY